MCFTPVTINRGYRKINARWTDAADVVPCGKCPDCLHQRSEAWAFRLYQEMKISSSAKFLTLTYSDENLPYHVNKETGELTPILVKDHFQKFMKKLRKKYPEKLKYYTCGEYGTKTNRPHYHSVMFNLCDGRHLSEKINNTWNLGHVDVKPINMARIRYVTKYITKKAYFKPALDDFPEFSLMSKGMGINYLTKAAIKHHKESLSGVITLKSGVLQPLPRYFKEKIFTKAERQKIAQECKELAEIAKDKKFDSAHHEVIWKKDQYRKIQKDLLIKRSQI